MKIGLQMIQSRGPRAVEIARLAEAAGFDGAWIADYMGEHANYLKAALLLDATSKLTVGTADEVREKATARYAGVAEYLDFYPMHDMSRASDDGPAHEFENLPRFVRAFEGFNK